jgi:hypothetical protein
MEDIMRNSIRLGLLGIVALILAGTGCSSTAQHTAKTTNDELKPFMALKVGDEVYVCNCGEKCPCHTMSKNPGQCSCGVDLVKAKVTRVDEGSAMVMINGKERSFKTVGKYACACGPACPCNTISQNPGKCTCGMEMKAVN